MRLELHGGALGGGEGRLRPDHGAHSARLAHDDGGRLADGRTGAQAVARGEEMGFDVGGVGEERGGAERAADDFGFDAVDAGVLEPELVLDGYGVLAGDDACRYPVRKRRVGTTYVEN